MRTLTALLKIDPGWLFIVPGLALIAATILIPALRDLETLKNQGLTLRQDESRVMARLAARAEFIDELESHSPRLLAHLASSQLNLMPASDTAVLVNPARTANVLEWIDSALPPVPPDQAAAPMSYLARWSTGPRRLWLLGAGVMAVFIGLFMGPGGTIRCRGCLIIAEPREEVHPESMYETQIQARSLAVAPPSEHSFSETLF